MAIEYAGKAHLWMKARASGSRIEGAALLLQTNTLVIIPGGRVRQEDLISFAPIFQHFDGADGAAAQFDLYPCRALPVGFELEKTDRALRLTSRGTTHVEDIVQKLQFDCAVNAQVRTRALWQSSVERNIYRDCSLLHGRINSRHVTFNDAVVCVNRGALAHLHVLGLRFRNLELGFEVARLCDPREDCSGIDLLSDLSLHLLQDAIRAGLNSERAYLSAFELAQSLMLEDARLLRGELCLCRAQVDIETLLFYPVAVG